MFERYTEQAKRAIFFARYEASQDGSAWIEPEHLLLGVLRANSWMFKYLIDQSKFPAWKEEIQKAVSKPSQTPMSTSVDMPLSETAKQLLDYTREEADALQNTRIGAEHMVLGILRQGRDSAKVLRERGITPEGVRSLIRRYGLDSAPAKPNRRTGYAAVRSRVGQGADCVEFICNGERVAICAIATAPLPRIGEEVVINNAELGLQAYRVLDITYLYEPNPPGATGTAHRMTKAVVHLESGADNTANYRRAPMDST